MSALLAPAGCLFTDLIPQGPLFFQLFIAYLFQTHLRGGGGLFNLEKTMVSVLHKELEYKVDKL